MQLTSKGASAPLPPAGIANFMASMVWSTAHDFDLMILAKTTGGDRKLFFYNSKGDLAADDLQLGEDQGVGDSAGANQEDCFIQSLAKYDTLVFAVADFTAIQTGAVARFGDSDVKVVLAGFGDDGSQPVNHEAIPSGGMAGNIAAIGRIEKSGPMYKFVNDDTATSLKGLGDMNPVFDTFGL